MWKEMKHSISMVNLKMRFNFENGCRFALRNGDKRSREKMKCVMACWCTKPISTFLNRLKTSWNSNKVNVAHMEIISHFSHGALCLCRCWRMHEPVHLKSRSRLCRITFTMHFSTLRNIQTDQRCAQLMAVRASVLVCMLERDPGKSSERKCLPSLYRIEFYFCWFRLWASASTVIVRCRAVVHCI